jgi:hypothetical protein
VSTSLTTTGGRRKKLGRFEVLNLSRPDWNNDLRSRRRLSVKGVAELVPHGRRFTLAVGYAHDVENELGAFFAIDCVRADHATGDKINVGAFITDATF